MLWGLFGNSFCRAVPVAAAAGAVWFCLANRCEANGLFTSIDETNGPFTPFI